MRYELIQLPMKTALSDFEQLRADYPKTQKYPFFIGGERNLKIFERGPKISVSEIEEAISRSFDVDMTQWFANRQKEERANKWFDEEEKLGHWAEISRKESMPYVLNEKRTGEKSEFVHTGLAEIEAPWMLPAIVSFGGWNDCPRVDVQCAAMRYWQEKYGAELITMSSDYLECLVKNPPETKEDAMELAWEQYFFCTDIVDQGTDTVSDLGAALLNTKLWFFWWD
jgi:hypothetical protein